jgi:hypothetical protein
MKSRRGKQPLDLTPAIGVRLQRLVGKFLEDFKNPAT